MARPRAGRAGGERLPRLRARDPEVQAPDAHPRAPRAAPSATEERDRRATSRSELRDRASSSVGSRREPRVEPRSAAVDGAQPRSSASAVDELVAASGSLLHELLVEACARSSSTARTRSPRGVGRRARPAACSRSMRRWVASTKRPSSARQNARDLLVVGRDLDDRAQQRRRARRRARRCSPAPSRSSSPGSPSPENHTSACCEEQLVDLLGEPHQQLALVAEVEVEGGARDPGAAARSRSMLELGEGRALGAAAPRWRPARPPGPPGAWRWARPWPSAHASLAPDPSDLTGCQMRARLTAMASLLDLTTQGDVGTITDESQLSERHAHDPAAALRAVGAPELGVPHDRLRPRTASDWAAMPDADVRDQVLEPGSLLRRRGARHDAVLAASSMAYEGQSEEAFLTTQQVDEARHAQHFNRFYEQVARLRRDLRGAPRAGRADAQRGLHPALRRDARRGATAAASPTRATSRPRSTSS